MSAIHWLSDLSGNFDAAVDWSSGVAPGVWDSAIPVAAETAFTMMEASDETAESIQTDASATSQGTPDVAEQTTAATSLYPGDLAFTSGVAKATRPFQWAEAVNGNFNTAADWTGGHVPGASNDAILDAAGAAFTVWARTSETVNSLHTAANATLHITKGTFSATSGTGLGLNAGSILVDQDATFAVGGKINNKGRIALDDSDLDVLADSTLTGGGTVVMIRSGAASRSYIHTNTTATLVNVDDTIRGYGTIGGPGLTLHNQAGGVIDAVGGIYLDAKTTTFTNAGLIEVSTGSGLQIYGNIQNSGSIIGGSGSGIFFDGGYSTLSTITNTGVIRFAPTASVSIENTTIDDSGGGVVGPFANLKIDVGVVLGGQLTISAAGTMYAFDYDHIRTSTLTNFGTIFVEQFEIGGGILQVQGLVVNDGGIQLLSPAGAVIPEARLILGANTTFTGGGTVHLAYGTASSISSFSPATLINVNNTIVGSGTIGSTEMTLVNQASGVIDAAYGIGAGRLYLNTGANVITNNGVIEVTQGYMIISSPIANSGTISVAGRAMIASAAVIGSGSAIINSGTLSFGSTFNENVTFDGTSGVLELAHSQAYTATIAGLSTTGASSLDLVDITFTSGVTKATFVDNGHQTGGVLTVTDGAHTATINLLGDYVATTFVASSDGHGGTDVAAEASKNATDPPLAFISAMAAFGPLSAGHTQAAETWAAREPLLASPKAAIA